MQKVLPSVKEVEGNEDIWLDAAIQAENRFHCE
jgi:hypothetical protein